MCNIKSRHFQIKPRKNIETTQTEKLGYLVSILLVKIIGTDDKKCRHSQDPTKTDYRKTRLIPNTKR